MATRFNQNRPTLLYRAAFSMTHVTTWYFTFLFVLRLKTGKKAMGLETNDLPLSRPDYEEHKLVSDICRSA